MGVVNITPDSFSDGGLFLDHDKAVKQGLRLQQQGADIIDIGGESTRPGSNPISHKEELDRVLPVIKELKQKTDILISIDTMKAKVAESALDAGADMINDISALRADPDMGFLAAERNTPAIMMHMLGTPKTMQENPSYDNVLHEIHAFFEERIDAAVSQGVKRSKLILDPGIGFGKRLQDNLILIKKLSFFADLDLPLLIGPSRKSFIGAILDLPATQRLEGTLASTTAGILSGAHIVRVHDVEAVRRAVLVTDAILNSSIKKGDIQKRGNKGTTYVH
ncbi:MAG: dihydropteroate synthase [Candidatus Aminicenantes bacterium]|nr:dihydropteroate synthase [Candidatus Aminicenantes bacterium]